MWKMTDSGESRTGPDMSAIVTSLVEILQPYMHFYFMKICHESIHLHVVMVVLRTVTLYSSSYQLKSDTTRLDIDVELCLANEM